MAKKPNKLKRNFWLLTIFFSFLTIVCLMSLWSNPQTGAHNSNMMGTTMGNMARTETGPFTLSDLFKPGEFVKSDMSSHHQGQNLIAQMHFGTTAIIVCLLPIILGGLAFLLIIWF